MPATFLRLLSPLGALEKSEAGLVATHLPRGAVLRVIGSAEGSKIVEIEQCRRLLVFAQDLEARSEPLAPPEAS